MTKCVRAHFSTYPGKISLPTLRCKCVRSALPCACEVALSPKDPIEGSEKAISGTKKEFN